MEDINNVSMTEYLGPTFSLNQYDSDGKKFDNGIYLHHGHTSIRVARTLRGFRAYIARLQSIVKEIEEKF